MTQAIKNSRAWQSVMCFIAQKRLPHALLITGNTFDRKRLFAMTLIQQLLCQQQKSCGQCRPCQWIKESVHPDVRILPNEDSDSIKIDDIRTISQHMMQTTHQGSHKIVLLAPAERMPMGAMNALLKTLEEPPSKSLLLLISQYPSLLTATIRSRCQRLMLEEDAHTAETEMSIAPLWQTLDALQARRLTPSQAAEQWQTVPLTQILENLYTCVTRIIQKQFLQGQDVKFLYTWYDFLNQYREQVMRRSNPNQVLVLENLFYRWQYYDAG